MVTSLGGVSESEPAWEPQPIAPQAVTEEPKPESLRLGSVGHTPEQIFEAVFRRDGIWYAICAVFLEDLIGRTSEDMAAVKLAATQELSARCAVEYLSCPRQIIPAILAFIIYA